MFLHQNSAMCEAIDRAGQSSDSLEEFLYFDINLDCDVSNISSNNRKNRCKCCSFS